jgi:transcriptional regulator with PAS, ATPase and Fis domain
MGESGVGKEMIARAIHGYGCARVPGSERPFIIINCPAIPESLLESEMFGHQRGSFTGAAKDFKGKVLLADGGTLFLDEVGDLPPAIQPKLLRVLEDKSFQPVGSNTTVRVNARVICTTNQDLERRMAEGTFRRDLFYRINALTMRIPPLRDRKADIRPLTDYFLKKYSLEMKKEVRISDGVLEAFQEYAWPGNVRELRNVVERAVVIVNSGAEIGLRDLPPDMFHGCRGAEPGPENRLETQERALILETLHQSGWNISRAAQTLGIPRGNLRYRIEKFGLAKGG